MSEAQDINKVDDGQSHLTVVLDVVALLKAVQVGLGQVGLQDGYIDYNYSEAIKKRVDDALKILTPND